MTPVTYTTNAGFYIGHKWRWVRWTHTEGNKHAAIIAKAAELGAAMWDYGQADHYPSDRYPWFTR